MSMGFSMDLCMFPLAIFSKPLSWMFLSLEQAVPITSLLPQAPFLLTAMASWSSSDSTFSRIRSILTLTELGTDSHPSASRPSSLFQKPSSCCSFIIYLSSVIGYFRNSAVTPTIVEKKSSFHWQLCHFLIMFMVLRNLGFFAVL